MPRSVMLVSTDVHLRRIDDVSTGFFFAGIHS
jgi:hypothetical protein